MNNHNKNNIASDLSNASAALDRLWKYNCTIRLSKLEHLLTNLQVALKKLLRWFPANHLVANAGKRNLPTS